MLLASSAALVKASLGDPVTVITNGIKGGTEGIDVGAVIEYEGVPVPLGKTMGKVVVDKLKLCVTKVLRTWVT